MRCRFVLLAAICSCNAPVDESPPVDAGVVLRGPTTLARQREALGGIALVPVVRPRARIEGVDKYTLAVEGIPIRNAGLRVRIAADGRDEVVDPLRIVAQAERTPVLTAEQATDRALAGRGAQVRARPPELAFEATVVAATDDARYREIVELRLTWRVDVIVEPHHRLSSYTVVVDAKDGAVLRDEPAFATATVQGIGAFGTYPALQAHGTLPLGQVPPDGSQCLADLTRGTAITNGDPCGAIGPGLHLFVDLPATATQAAELRRVVDTDGVFGNGAWALTRAQAEGEEGRTTAADAQVGIARAYDLYKLLGRTVLGRDDTLVVRVNAQENPGNAHWHYGSGSISVGTWVGNTTNAVQPLANVELLTHEYTHGVLATEVGTPVSANSQWSALHEGLGDIFGVIADASPGATIVDPSSWVFADGLFTGDSRYFDRPSRGDRGWDAVTFDNLLDLANGVTGPHQAGGVIRRVFYFLSHGVVASPSGAYNTSPDYLPEGTAGIGVEPALRILWRAISEFLSPGAQPNFLDFRDAMLGAAESLGHARCSFTHKAVQDAWAAVNVGDKADRTAPTATLKATRMGSTGRVMLAVFAQEGETPTATMRVDAETSVVLLSYASDPIVSHIACGSTNARCHYGFIDIPNIGPGQHEAEASVIDGCNNSVTVSKKFELDAPTGLSIVDKNTWRSTLRRFALTASDSSPLTYRLEVGSVYTSGTLQSGVVREIELDLSSLPDGTTTIRFTAKDLDGTETAITQPYLVDRTPPSDCGLSSTTEPTGFRVRLYGCDEETQIEILDIWVNGAPFWWADRNYTGDRALQPQQAPHCANFSRSYATSSYALYNLEGRCVDSWGNVTVDTWAYPYAPPPTVSASSSTNASAGTFTISASGSTLAFEDMRAILLREGTVTLEEKECIGTSPTCSASFTRSQPAGTTRTYEVMAIDRTYRSSTRTLSVTMPQPPPPPPNTTFNESEDNDRPQTADLPPSNTTTVNGTVVVGDRDAWCSETTAQFYAGCNILQPWNCTSQACGDYFGFDVDPGQSLTYNSSTWSHLCFRWGDTILFNVGESVSPFARTSVSAGTRLTNTSNVRRRVFLYAARKLDIACTTGTQRSYTFTVSRP